MTTLVVWYLVALISNTSQVTYTGPYSYEFCMAKADALTRQHAIYAYCTPEERK